MKVGTSYAVLAIRKFSEVSFLVAVILSVFPVWPTVCELLVFEVYGRLVQVSKMSQLIQGSYSRL